MKDKLKPKRITDKFLASVLLPDRYYRDYYSDNEFGRFTIRMNTGSAPQLLLNRDAICEVKFQHEVVALMSLLKIPKRGGIE